MRAKMKIVGLGERKSGISKKNNKPYDFISVSVVYPDKFVEGFKADTCNVDYGMVDAVGGLVLNEERDVFFHTYNNALVIDGIL